MNRILTQEAGILMDNTFLADCFVRANMAHPIQQHYLHLAKANFTSKSGTTCLLLKMPLPLYAYIAPGQDPLDPANTTNFVRPQLQGYEVNGQSHESLPMQLVSTFNSPKYLERFLGQSWNRFTISQDCAERGFKVLPHSLSTHTFLLCSFSFHCIFQSLMQSPLTNPTPPPFCRS